MKIINIIFIALLSECVTKSIEFDNDPNTLTFPSYALLKIAPTFEQPIEYELTQHEPYMLLYSEYKGKGGYNWGEKKQ